MIKSLFSKKNNCNVLSAEQKEILRLLIKVLGESNVLQSSIKNEHFRKGWRSGEGAALAVIFPKSLLEIWKCLEICVESNAIIIMQAANTGLTEGSTPKGDNYDRPVIVINTLAISSLFL